MTSAATIWFPNTSEISINKLQIIQSSAVGIATGCVGMTAIDQFHTEPKTFKVDKHLRMLCLQFLVTGFQPEHVAFPIVSANSGQS